MTWLLRSSVFIALVCFSVAAPVGLVVWSIDLAFGDKWSTNFAADYRIYNHTAVNGGELWYFSLVQYGMARDPRNKCHVRHLNLDTGEDLATGIVVPGDDCKLIWLNDSLYLCSSNESLARWNGSSLIDLPYSPTTAHPVSEEPFVFEGKLTMLAEFEPQRFRLQHLIEDRWIDGREVVIPTSDQFEGLYSEAGRAFIQMYLTSSQRPMTFHYRVQSMSREPRLVVSDLGSGYKVFREGFQFVDEPSEIASALRPENSSPVLWNWHAYDPDEHQVFIARSISIGDGELLTLDDGRLFRCRFGEEEGEIRVGVGSFDAESLVRTHLLTSEDRSKQYILCEDGANLQRATIQRLEGSRILPPHVWQAGIGGQYLNRWRQLLASVVAAWIAHLSVVLAGMEWLRWSQKRKQLDGDFPQVLLATLTRRALARVIDVVVGLAILISVGVWVIIWPEVAPEEWCYVMRGIEWSVGDTCSAVMSDWTAAWENWEIVRDSFSGDVTRFCNVILAEFSISPLSYLAMAGLACLLLFLYCRVEGLYGVTPGKWLLAIRVVRLDQRASGFSRSLLRTVLLWLDLFPFVTPLFAVTSLLFSSQQQRVGDRLADTVVIRRPVLK